MRPCRHLAGEVHSRGQTVVEFRSMGVGLPRAFVTFTLLGCACESESHAPTSVRW